MGNNYSTNITFNVNYQNTPKNKVILNELPQKIDIKIKGLGFDLLAYKLQLKQPIVTVNLTTLKNFNRKEGTIVTQTLSTKNFQPYISTQLGEHLDIQTIFPDSIYFELDEKVEKLLLIVPKTTITYDQQYQLFGEMLLKPAVVNVSGPKSVLDTMRKIYTEELVLEGLNKTTTEALVFSSEYNKQQLTFNPQQVFIHIPIEKYTESIKKVKLNAINVPENIVLKAIPGEIEVKFRVPLSKIAALENAVFSAEIDYQQINQEFNHKLKVNLTSYPDFIQSITLTPTKVEYILKKND
ncbi:MAG: hypothetical protein J5I47_08840 [Vicingus serpentipes]|nr:hypothetical protein [Vicingus serpentipes]